mmetsp:Transcript_32106/g.78012  ORF Transcript_32106/g.78012 Transcript_32106/m.78012 type:complete len:578 (-) Transcript_32106:24-1757(-)
MNNGTAFTIHDVQQFERELLPKYFNTQKYASFTRALCSYGFDCVRTGRQTGIYSHPKFNRNDPESPSLIKRVKKVNNAKAALSNTQVTEALHNRASNLSQGLLFQGGERSIMFPTLADDGSHINQVGNASSFRQVYQNIRSQIADQTTKALVRLPPGATQLVSPIIESDNDNSVVGWGSSGRIPAGYSGPFNLSAGSKKWMGDPQRAQNFVPIVDGNAAAASTPASRAAATTTTTRGNLVGDQKERHEQIAQNYTNRAILDDHVAPIPLSPELNPLEPHALHMHDAVSKKDQDDFEPIPWSPKHSPQYTPLQQDHDNTSQQQTPLQDHNNVPAAGESDHDALLSSLEPRSIQNMKENPDELNAWYNVLPIIPKARYNALYEYSSPVSLPAAFYYMDISKFGISWACFLILGHTIQSLFTAFGPDTRDLVLSPKISIVKHNFMDIIWMHSLLSAMVLVPEYFGSSSVVLGTVFISTQPPSLATSLKNHYHNHNKRQKGVPFVHGEWWIADIVRLLFLGYMIAILFISLGHYSDIANLKVIGVFVMNLAPLFACESYQMLLSIPARLEYQYSSSDKKRK